MNLSHGQKRTRSPFHGAKWKAPAWFGLVATAPTAFAINVRREPVPRGSVLASIFSPEAFTKGRKCSSVTDFSSNFEQNERCRGKTTKGVPQTDTNRTVAAVESGTSREATPSLVVSRRTKNKKQNEKDKILPFSSQNKTGQGFILPTPDLVLPRAPLPPPCLDEASSLAVSQQICIM